VRPLGDRVIEHLRDVADLPDLSGTRYELVRRLAKGGMGTVYVVRDTVLDREVALKVMGEPDAAGELAARFQGESRILAGLEHPNIVPVHDAGALADGRAYYAMKLVRGQRLDEWRRSAAPARPEVLRVFRKICEAVGFAHAHGVVHRDLKPANIMIGPFGEALVMDWGVARLLSRPSSAVPSVREGPDGRASHLTGAGTVIGTPAYMSPEQARGESVDARSDVYSLGAVLAALLASDRELPRRLAAICARARAADPADRYPSAQELGEDVDRFLDGLPVRARPESRLERAGRAVLRHRAVVLLVLAYLAMRVLVLFWAGR
jgi:serine/threonine protein kinase